MDTVEVSVDQIIESMEENGYIHCRGSWFRDDDKFNIYGGTEEAPITQACILGQTALNLGVENLDLQNALNQLKIPTNPWLARRGYSKSEGWSEVGIGSAAIEYNDATDLTYNKIAAKVRGWLEPYRGKTFIMTKKEYIARKKDQTND